MEDTEIILPPLPEQQRIVGVLDEAFEGIATAKANAETNRQNARALFESHLQSVFTQRGAGWENATIEQLIRFIDYRGKTPKKTRKWLAANHRQKRKMGYVQETPMEFVAPDSYDSWMTARPKLGDVLFHNEVPLTMWHNWTLLKKVVFAQTHHLMQPNPAKLDSTFLKYLLLSQPVQQRIHSNGTV